MKTLFAVVLMLAVAVPAIAQEKPKVEGNTEAKQVAATAKPEVKPAPAAPKKPPTPVIMFEQGAIPLSVHTVRIDPLTVTCDTRTSGVLYCKGRASTPKRRGK